MKRFIILLSIATLCQVTVLGQKKYEMLIEKTDGSEIAVNVEDIVRTYFRERNTGGNGGGGEEYTSCPNSNHPHMIDLGLPSGTKWACCNVGASSPEQYGNYYAWGETSPKSVYDTDTYQYCNSSLDYVNIGSDIAGTGYDAATANWGAPWRMPSFAQIQELMDKCSSSWTTQNGVNGRKFVGPNGESVFLPAAGKRQFGKLIGVGSGFYWSSTLRESLPFQSLYLDFDSGGVYKGYEGRVFGLSVRPVR